MSLINIIQNMLTKEVERKMCIKNDNRAKKVEAYHNLINCLPTEITIMPNNFISEQTPWWGAENAKRVMEAKQKLLEDELNRYKMFSAAEESHNSRLNDNSAIASIEMELSNIRFFLDSLQKYMDEYHAVTSKLNEYKESNFFSDFKIYASREVQTGLANFETAYSNAYYTSQGGYSITKALMNELIANVTNCIREELGVD